MGEGDDGDRAARPTTLVRAKQRRATPTIDALVEATIRALQEHGEAAFRVDDVLAETRTSKGSLYHHFTSRDGLIEAATLLEFSRHIDEDTATLRAALEGAVDQADLLARLDAITEATQSPERAGRRATRVRILGTAVTRPSLWAAIGREQSRLTDAAAEVIADGQRRGLVSRDHDPRVVAVLIQAYTLGRVLSDIDPNPVDPAAWTATIRSVVVGLVVGEGDRPTRGQTDAS
jgi:AcrR family transcriptional regulator